jgi:hypothetical protein
MGHTSIFLLLAMLPSLAVSRSFPPLPQLFYETATIKKRLAELGDQVLARQKTLLAGGLDSEKQKDDYDILTFLGEHVNKLEIKCRALNSTIFLASLVTDQDFIPIAMQSVDAGHAEVKQSTLALSGYVEKLQSYPSSKEVSQLLITASTLLRSYLTVLSDQNAMMVKKN